MRSMMVATLAASIFLVSPLQSAYADVNYDLMKAAHDGDSAAAASLLSQGADVNRIDGYGQTPLIWAAQQGSEDVVRLLLNRGASVDVRDARGYTALMWATQQGYSNTASILLSHGADPNAQSPQGESALDIAQKMHNTAFVKLFSKPVSQPLAFATASTPPELPPGPAQPQAINYPLSNYNAVQPNYGVGTPGVSPGTLSPYEKQMLLSQQPKEPLIGGLASWLVPGLGQMYAGDMNGGFWTLGRQVLIMGVTLAGTVLLFPSVPTSPTAGTISSYASALETPLLFEGVGLICFIAGDIWGIVDGVNAVNTYNDDLARKKQAILP